MLTANFLKIQPSEDIPKDQLRSETVDLHILRPTDGSTIPQLSDVTTLSNVPHERIMRTFENCAGLTQPCSTQLAMRAASAAFNTVPR